METVFTEDVLVTAARAPMLAPEVPRGIIILSASEIEKAPADNLQDLLSYYSGIDIRKRGPEGVQADVSIRGGTFEQTLILLNGVRISDPQTAHNNLNIPVNLNDIEKIEILKGQASGLYGANALSGVINIITKKGKKSELAVNAAAGGFGFYSAGASLSEPISRLNNRLSFSREHSSGYRYNTDFTNSTISYNTSLLFSSGHADIFAGYTDREFGANGFYSDKYLNQRERIKTLFLTASADYNPGNLAVNPVFFWRSNKDNYLLDFTRPDFYNNLHTTNSYGSQIQLSYKTSSGTVTAGAEIGSDDINSNNLGIHNRSTGGFSAGYIFSGVKDFKIIASGYAYKYAGFGWKLCPGLDAGYNLSGDLNVYFSAGRSFRLPSFTEMYYSSPIQKGNALLHPEEAVSFETGIKSSDSRISFNAAAFFRKGNNFIDWVRSGADVPWHAENVAELTTRGIEAGIQLHRSFFESLPLNLISLNYTYIDADLVKSPLQSRYVLDHLRHQLNVMINHDMPLDILMSWSFRYENRFNQDQYFITDGKISRSLTNFDLYLQVSNIFNVNYTGTGGIPMPGRWFTGGIRYNLNNF
ncbi:MAG: TonB-dependent receptor plug domain-containing protein [Syntrophothermus sp.]